MSPAEVLLRAADRVQFEGWVQSTFAEDADGKITSSKSPNAVKWCARGAMKSVSPSTWQMEQAYGAAVAGPMVLWPGMMLLAAPPAKWPTPCAGSQRNSRTGR